MPGRRNLPRKLWVCKLFVQHLFGLAQATREVPYPSSFAKEDPSRAPAAMRFLAGFLCEIANLVLAEGIPWQLCPPLPSSVYSPASDSAIAPAWPPATRRPATNISQPRAG